MLNLGQYVWKVADRRKNPWCTRTASNLLGKHISFNGPIIECLPVIAEGSFASINKPSIIFAWPWRACLFPLPKGYGCYVWYVRTVAAFWQNCFCCCLVDIYCIYFSQCSWFLGFTRALPSFCTLTFAHSFTPPPTHLRPLVTLTCFYNSPDLAGTSSIREAL